MDTEIKSFLSSVFRSEAADGTITGAMCGIPTSYIEEPMFGIDEELPLQLYQLAIEQCIDEGYLQGPYYYDPTHSDPLWVRKEVVARAHPVTEAGNKVRWVTMEGSYVTIVQQVLGHWLAGIAQHVPNLTSAFTRSYKGWDLSVQLMRGNTRAQPGYGLGTYDLTGASNRLNIDLCRMIGYEFINRFAQTEMVRQFLFKVLGLVLAPRRILVFRPEKDHQAFGPDPMYLAFRQTNGLLMGNPVTKELLCLVSAVCISVTTSIIHETSLSLVAGDDVGIYCSRKFFDKLLEVNVALGNEIQTTKTMFSHRCAFFCEEVLDLIPGSIGSGSTPWMSNYETENIHVDTVKLRLLSPFEGTQSQLHSPTYKNPAIGKAGALARVLSWFPDNKIKGIVQRRFLRWMADFANCGDPLVFMPRIFGGYDFPWVKTRDELLARILEEVPVDYISMVEQLRTEPSYHGLIDYLLKRMATGNTCRGLFDQNLYIMIGQFASIAQMLGLEGLRNFEDFKVELQNIKSYHVSNRDVLLYIKRSGYMGQSAIAELVDRLTGIRLSFCAAAGTLPLGEYLLVKKRRVPTPTEVFQDFLSMEVPMHFRIGGLSTSDLCVTSRQIQSFKEWVRTTPDLSTVVRRREQLFVPASFIKDSLNGMRIPLPYRPPGRPVRGSLDDTYRNPDATGWIAHVVSLNRLREN
jgi:hypothetical protein